MADLDSRYDLGIIGGGIIGAAAAAYAAESGLSVLLCERAELASGASGRNSGAVQSPFDPVFAVLHRRSVELYRETAAADAGFEMPPSPAGLMLVSFDEDAVSATHAALIESRPELQPQLLRAGEAARLEHALHPELAACRLETGYPVAPATATMAFARRAEAAGTDVVTGAEVTVEITAGRATGIRLEGSTVACDRVLIAAGPWTPELVPGWAEVPPIRAIWGVVTSTTIAASPVHILEELGIGHESEMSGRLFSLVTVGGAASIGSTFLEDLPDVEALAVEIMARGARFVPALGSAQIQSTRACARPASFDGRPIIGAISGVEGLYLCAGHGPWGISTGPASAELIVAQMRGVSDEWPELSPTRIGARPTSNTESA